MQRYNCMKIKVTYNGKIITNDESLFIMSHPDLSSSINSLSNPLWRAANLIHDPEGMYWYARIIDDMYQDYEKAAHFYQLAADEGIIPAKYNLAICYSAGEGVTKDLDHARRLMNEAVQVGLPFALMYTGSRYDTGDNGYPHDATKSFQNYLLAAQCNHPLAQNNVGYCYITGEGVEKDISQGIYWYKIAAENGNSNAIDVVKKNGIQYNEPSLEAKMINDCYMRSIV